MFGLNPQAILIKVLVAVIFIGGGAVAGVAWEHRHESKGILTLAGPSLAVQRDRARREAHDWKAAATGYKAAFDLCDKKRSEANRRATQNVTTASAAADTRGSSAYDNGYFAGRIAGKASCKKATTTDAAPPDPRPVPAADGVRDLSKAFGTPYSPGG